MTLKFISLLPTSSLLEGINTVSDKTFAETSNNCCGNFDSSQLSLVRKPEDNQCFIVLLKDNYRVEPFRSLVKTQCEFQNLYCLTIEALRR